MFGILIVTLPFYVLLFFVYKLLGSGWSLLLFGFLSFFVGVIIGLVSLDFLLDKLVITNKRVVWVNWRSLFYREEHEVELIDIQDVEVQARGVLSKLPGFDYGLLVIETAASKTAIHFADCPDPDQVEHFLVVQTEALRSATPNA